MNEPERLLSRSPGASSAEHRGEHVGTKKSRTELVQQLADSAPALVAAAEAIDGLQLQRELLKLDPDCNTKMAQAINSALAARGLRPPAPGTPADPQQAEAADIDRFRRHRRPFVEAFAELQHELAGILRTDGVLVDGLHAPSACAILSGRAEAFARVLNAGAVPDRTFGEWGELATLVSCEVAALTRPNSQAPAAEAGPRAMPLHRHAELVAQLEAVAPPLLEFACKAYRRGWAEEPPAAGDLDAVRAMLPPFAEAVEQLGPSLHARRRGAWLDLDGWGGTSACAILHGLASSLAREIERGQLPRDRRHLVGEGLSQLLVPAWWEQLRRHLQHDLDLLVGRATEEIEPGAPTRPPKPRIHAKIAHQILAAIASDTGGVLISWSAIAEAIGCRNESTVRRAGIRLVNDRCIEQVDGRMTPYRLLHRGREILSR